MEFLEATFLHPWAAITGLGLFLLALGFGFWAASRPGLGVRVVGQRPLLQGPGIALVLLGAGLGIAQPRWGLPEVPRLTVHIILDASRSMLVPDMAGHSRWHGAEHILDKLWAHPIPGVKYSLDLLTGDAIPLMPPGEDLGLLQDALKAIQPGEIGSQGTSMGRGIPQVAATATKGEPSILLLLGDGEETWESEKDAQERATKFLHENHLPLFAICLGSPVPQLVPQAPSPDGQPSLEPALSAAHPEWMKALAESTGGKLLSPGTDLETLFRDLSTGRKALPKQRSKQPSRPEWGAWIAMAGLGLWFLGAGKTMRSWRPILLLLLAVNMPARAQMPLPQSVKAWLAQTALDQGDLDTAKRWRPTGEVPNHLLLAAQIDLKARDFQGALKTLTPLTGQGVRRPVPAWRAPALLLAARAQIALEHPEEAITLMERLLKEQPGQADAAHNLQSLLQDKTPPPPNPKKPPPPPPPRPSMGARQDELEGIQQRMPRKPPPQGVKDQ